MTAAYSIADTDPVSVVLSWLREHPRVAEALGGRGRVSGISEAPWPHLRISHGPGGNMRTLTWGIEPEVTLELYGYPGGWPGQAELRRHILVCAAAASELPDALPSPGQPVVSGVRPSGTLVWSPLVDGQPRWVLGLLVALHP